MTVSFHAWDIATPASQMVSLTVPGQVQVWTASIPGNEVDLTRYIGALGREERDRAARFEADQPRRQFIFGRFCLRRLLAACLQIEPAELVFGVQPGGKPCLMSPATRPDLRFNLSHSGEMLAIALARGREVGVDLEWINGLEDWDDLGDRVFSARELAGLHSLPLSQQRLAFFNGWTRKEAWLKATGQGLTDALPTIEVTLAPGMEAKWVSLPGGPQALQQWELHTLPLPADYAGALVIQNH